MPEIVFIMGKSASGKDNIYQRLADDRELGLKKIIMYTTRPMRAGETQGVEYYFVDEDRAQQMQKSGKIIEMRCYNTVYGAWKYFTADDGQVDLEKNNYLGIGTLESYLKLKEYYGEDALCPLYVEVEDGIRLERALKRERKQQQPKYAEMCRRFLADCEDFSEEKIEQAGIRKRFYNNGAIEDCFSEIQNFVEQVKKL